MGNISTSDSDNLNSPPEDNNLPSKPKTKRPFKHRKRLSLTHKARLFVENYLRDSNATKAATLAGYSKKTAYSIGNELLKKPEIKAHLASRMRREEEKTDVSIDYVVRNLKEVAERTMTHVPVMEWDYEDKCMKQKTVFDPTVGKVVGVYEFDSNGACRSLELLGKYKKMFVDRAEVNITGSITEMLRGAKERISKTQSRDNPPGDIPTES